MSVLINMEMPQDCGYCIFERHTSDGYECLINGTLTEYQKRPDDCPLVPVPEHGDLIDRDALFPVYANLLDGGDVKAVVPRIVIDTAPTIIPTEEGVKTEEDSELWLCLSCRHYPPSSTDGKPCSQCNPSEVWHSCYDPAEESE